MHGEHVPPAPHAIERDAGLSIESLTVRRGDRRVLQACTLSLPLRQVHAIVGHNGAGKTTLFDTLFGFLMPEGGQVRFGARALQREDVAYLPTTLELYAGLTGRELLVLFGHGELAPTAQRQATALDVPIDERIDSYSYGTRRKLALIGVLSLRRPVLLLDEPFEALDVVSRRIVRHLLRRAAAEGQTVIFSAHELEALASFCDSVSLLQDGAVQGQYPALTMPTLESLLAREVDRRVGVLDRVD
ncbi:MAG: ATP-binding cassette domain-containing protein [Gemmatimonadetes bacterium]|nr:ATP-binding cassette domain-containing protein [Gemmatimonadota bacterium]